MIKEFTEYMNSFYGVDGLYSSGRNLTVEEVADAVVLLLSGGHPEWTDYKWGDGDSFDREVVRDIVFSEIELIKMYNMK